MPVLSNAAIRDVRLGSTKAKKVYLGTNLVWEDIQGLAKNYSGTGWYKAVDTGTVFCKGIPSRQTYSFTGDPKVYISVHTKEDAILYADRAATSNMVDMYTLFSKTPTFNADISHWDVSNVTTLELMFYQNSVFNQNISNWDVSNVTTMRNMFYGARAFNQNISNWNVSKVTDMTTMFYDASRFNQNISNWDVSKVTDMGGMFWYAKVFNQNLSKWCVTNIKSSPSRFSEGSALTAANTPKWGTCPRG